MPKYHNQTVCDTLRKVSCVYYKHYKVSSAFLFYPLKETHSKEIEDVWIFYLQKYDIINRTTLY